MNKLADQLIQARTENIALRARVKELEAERDTVIIAMDVLRGATDLYRRSSAAWKRSAKKWYSYALFWQRKRTEELAGVLESVRGLKSDTAKLRAIITNVAGLIPYWQRLADEAEAHPQGKLIAAMYRGAIADVKMAIDAGAESGE